VEAAADASTLGCAVPPAVFASNQKLEKLAASEFVQRGGTSVVRDQGGNSYIACGQVYIYNGDGNQIGMLGLPERPGRLAFGGPDKKTLYIGARTSIYAVRIKLASKIHGERNLPRPGLKKSADNWDCMRYCDCA
jgi:hypothetical protein